ncbi:MAG TPA: PilX N-terminal domain-containing pilus assembly protein [Candidatus Angelobacter sp.]|jgi:hypothetical protein
MNGKTTKQMKSQRGIAMMVALLALLLLSAIGLGLMFMADTENSVNNNYRDSQKAYFAARAGAEQARLLLSSNTALSNTALGLSMPTSSANTGILYLTNPTGGEPINPSGTASNRYLDDQLCWEKYTGLPLIPGSGPCGSNSQNNQLLTSSTAFTTSTMSAPGVGGSDALPFKWVRITNKQNLIGPLGVKVAGTAANNLQVCWDGKEEVPISAGTCATQSPQAMTPVWMLTSLAVTPKMGNNAGSRRIVQMEVALVPPIVPPGTVAAQAPINLQGNLQVNGYDNCKCTATETSRPGQTCDGSHVAVYSAQGVSNSGQQKGLVSGLGNGMTTYDANGNVTSQGATAQNQPWPYDVNQMILDYKSSAQNAATTAPWNFSCTGSPADCGSPAGAQFGGFPTGLPSAPVFAANNGPAQVYIPGSVHLTGDAQGSGILIIDGDLEINGGLAFYGLILVKGKIRFTGGGSEKVNLYGAMLAGEDVNASDAAILDTIGGSFSFQYDSCALKLFPSQGPPKLLATHEIMY